MRALANKLKPSSGYSHFFHVGLNAFLPFLIFVLVRIDLAAIGAAMVVIAKWRMFSVRPRHWLASVRANSVDIIAGLSFVAMMAQSTTMSQQFMWALLYLVWLIAIKPGSSVLQTSLQAVIAQGLGLNAILRIGARDASLLVLVLLVWLVSYSAARHFFMAFEEQYSAVFAQTWGYFAAALTWILGHWLLFYGSVAQITLLLTVIGFGLGAMYYLEHNDKLSLLLKRQFIFIMAALLIVVIVFSDWSDRSV